MKQAWKWIGIALGVLLIFLIIAVPVFMGIFGFGRMGMMDNGFRGMHGGGILWFMGGWAMMFSRLLFPLLIIGLLVWGGYALGKGASRRPAAQTAAVNSQAAPQMPAAAAAQQDSQPIPASAAAACPHCGGETHAGWVACPHCGEKL